MKKALNGQFLLSALALSLAALFTACQSTPTPIAAELKPLQGSWEGEGAGGKCSITITGNSLHYRAGTTWYETTFTLPAGTDPQQLRATIKDCGPSKDALGTVVFVIYKLEDETLTLTTYDPSDEPPKTFNSANLYVVKKVHPQKENAEPSKTG
ncbi:MAG: hypothetical protein ILNGONEN_00814 [Syntrophorhabdaceae bacterium]|nr:hypothetical protein [Syntrophorhabdaceae bacterium]